MLAASLHPNSTHSERQTRMADMRGMGALLVCPLVYITEPALRRGGTEERTTTTKEKRRKGSSLELFLQRKNTKGQAITGQLSFPSTPSSFPCSFPPSHSHSPLRFSQSQQGNRSLLCGSVKRPHTRQSLSGAACRLHEPLFLSFLFFYLENLSHARRKISAVALVPITVGVGAPHPAGLLLMDYWVCISVG